MIAVIQCASRKRPDAGHLRTLAGKPVHFVARPGDAPVDEQIVYARPDDPSGYGSSWRGALLHYNEDVTGNPLRLLPAWQLYENRAYGRLVESLGVEKVFILSAGWGLIRADFLTPYYDITFSPSAEAYKRRRHEDRFSDFRMIPPTANDEVLFFGGKDYLPLFCRLTAGSTGNRRVFYNSSRVPEATGCKLVRFQTLTRTNWHYECVHAFLDGQPSAV